jgi:hypothetical protein
MIAYPIISPRGFAYVSGILASSKRIRTTMAMMFDNNAKMKTVKMSERVDII